MIRDEDLKQAIDYSEGQKDAYDIYCMIDNYKGGVRALANEFEPYADKNLFKSCVRSWMKSLHQFSTLVL